jgi:hypothetical protein
MTTEEAIKAIDKILEEHCAGTYESGLKMVHYLRQKAEEQNEGVQDAMSSRNE